MYLAGHDNYGETDSTWNWRHLPIWKYMLQSSHLGWNVDIGSVVQPTSQTISCTNVIKYLVV